MISLKKIKEFLQKSNIYFVLIATILFVLILSFISYQELQREKNYLRELASSEGLNIAFSIQMLGSEFILNRDILIQVLDLFQKEGITFIDVVDRNGIIRLSTDEQRTNQQVAIEYHGEVNYIQSRDSEDRRILEILKPFDFDQRFPSDLFGYLFLQDKYLLIGVNLEDYDFRYNQIKQRLILNYLTILLLSLLGIYMIFRIQESIVVKRTLDSMRNYTTKLLETMDSGVISVDKQNIIKTFNRKSEEIFQMTRDEVIEKDAEEVLPIQVKDESLYQVGLREGKKIEQEIEFLTKNHSRKILEVNTSLLSNENDQDGGMVVLIRDVSRLKSLSEEINRNKRLASLGKLSSGIAHEIRNPLSAIRGLAQFLYQSCMNADERKEDLKIILDEVDRLDRLINEILDFSKSKKLEISKFSLHDLIRELVQLLSKESKEKKDISFQLELPPDEQLLQADRNQIRQVLMNILLNAIQAIPEKGEINISLEYSLFKNRDAVQIIIQDNGAGIESGDLIHIFDPFFTSRSDGSGLGLSIAYNIMEVHQGDIKAESEKGKGTIMRIFLPLRRNREDE